MSNPTALALQGNMAMLFTSEIVLVEGPVINTFNGRQLVQHRFGNAGFALAALACVYAVLFFRNPYGKMLLLIVLVLPAGVVLGAAHLAAVAGSLGENDRLAEVLWGAKEALMGLPGILLLWAMVVWSACESRLIAHAESADPTPT